METFKVSSLPDAPRTLFDYYTYAIATVNSADTNDG